MSVCTVERVNEAATGRKGVRLSVDIGSIGGVSILAAIAFLLTRAGLHRQR